MSLATYTRFLKDKNLSDYSGTAAKIFAQSLGFQLVNSGDPIESLTITLSGTMYAIGVPAICFRGASLDAASGILCRRVLRSVPAVLPVGIAELPMSVKAARPDKQKEWKTRS